MEQLQAGEARKVVVGSTPSWVAQNHQWRQIKWNEGAHSLDPSRQFTGLRSAPLSKGAIPPMKVRRARLNLLLHNRQQHF